MLDYDMQITNGIEKFVDNFNAAHDRLKDSMKNFKAFKEEESMGNYNPNNNPDDDPDHQRYIQDNIDYEFKQMAYNLKHLKLTTRRLDVEAEKSMDKIEKIMDDHKSKYR